jgi:hypothetical protein
MILTQPGKNIKISAKESLRYYELKKHNPWFNEGCSKQDELQSLQDLSQIYGDILNIRSKASQNFRNKKRKYLKGKTDEYEMNSKNKDIRDLYREKKN